LKRRTIIIGILLFLLISIAFGVYYGIKVQENYTFKTRKAVRGDIARTISATGTVNPVTIVNVGAQVSGKVWRLFADFNSVVNKGDIVAEIDPELFKRDVEEGKAKVESARATLKSALENVSLAGSKVRSAAADLERVKAGLTYARKEYERYVDLFERELVSASERDQRELDYKQSLAQVESAVADLNAQKANLSAKRANYQADTSQVKSAEVALSRAKTNLDYTIIRSPVDGVVVSREVDEGQTLTARMQTPLLFKIAEDLTKMQVNASIDEADIGCIGEGQNVLFTVDAFPYITFEGIVKQVRIAPITVENVVTYDVITEAKNMELKLKPGMTADVTILVEQKSDIVKIPNEALRFRPPGDMKIAGDVGMRRKAGNSRLVWRMDKGGTLEPVPIKTGITDGEYTELLGKGISEDDELVVSLLERSGRPVISRKAGSALRPSHFRGFR